jgi:hypothetical protein
MTSQVSVVKADYPQSTKSNKQKVVNVLWPQRAAMRPEVDIKGKSSRPKTDCVSWCAY